MQIIKTTTGGVEVDVHANAIDARHCTVGEPVAISAVPAVERVVISDQPDGTAANFSTSEITCLEPGEHRFAIFFADRTVGGLRLVAHESVKKET